VLDARSKGAYRRSHIRGARHADLFHYFVPGTDPKGLERFQKDLARRLGSIGLSGSETIVVYESRFGMRAARVAWMLEYAGAHRVFLLEGGFQVWRESRYPTEQRVVRRDPLVFRIRPVSMLLATADVVRSTRSATILDVRSEGEFTGKEGRECDARLGRIPRAQWLEWSDFVHQGRRFKTASEMRPALQLRGLKKHREVVTYCHRGARAASAFYALRSLGYGNVKNYIGSWHEWSATRSLPVER
jgi:thiosulfate/3-mercaptopyruvate sulfurtransferase